MQSLDPTLDAAILDMADRLFPDGFDVSDDAPDTYKKLKAHLDAGKRMVVYGGGCERTIFGAPEVNHAFRAWHDWCHCQGEHDFSIRGEAATCMMMIAELLKRYGDTQQTEHWCRILQAEVIGQRLYYERHKRYIDDQRGFIEAYLKEPDDTLLWPLW